MTEFRTLQDTPLHLRPSFTVDVVGEIERSGGDLVSALRMQFQVSRLRRVEAIDAGDTLFSDEFPRAMSIAKRIGFVELGSVELDSRPGDTLHVLQHSEAGFMLVMTSYSNSGTYPVPHVNTADLYYAIKPRPEQMQDLYSSGAGGGWESLSKPNWSRDPEHVNDSMKEINYPADALYIGKIDARECLASKFKMLAKCNPHKYPIAEYCDVFQEALTQNCDYTFRGLQSINFKKNGEILTEVAYQRAKIMGISPTLFGRAA